MTVIILTERFRLYFRKMILDSSVEGGLERSRDSEISQTATAVGPDRGGEDISDDIREGEMKPESI